MRTITAKTEGITPIQKASSDPLTRYAELNLCFIKDLFTVLLSDFVNLNPSYRSVDSARDLATIHRRLDNEGLGFLSKTLPSLMASLFLKIEGVCLTTADFVLAAEYLYFSIGCSFRFLKMVKIKKCPFHRYTKSAQYLKNCEDPLKKRY